MRRLKSVGLYDQALFIVTADHGASIEPNGYMRNVVASNLADIAAVPLFVKYPGQRRGKIDDRDAKTIDIVPTIADVLGVRIPWHVDGVSLRGAPVSRAVSVSKSHGDPVVGAPSVVEAGVLATARRNASWFGAGRHSMYRIGPITELLGRQAVPLLLAGSQRDDIRFDDPTSFADVRISSPLVPARIAGEIRGDGVRRGTPLAIAVDGRVRAMTRAYQLDGRSRFVALVPETSFHEGRNAVEIYAVSRSKGAFSLVRLGGTPPTEERTSVVRAASSARRSAGPRTP